MLVINGIELELNIFEATQAEAFEEANKKVLSEKTKIDNVSGLTDKIKFFCDIVYDFFDDVFGEGTADKVFEGRMDMLECLEAYTEVIEYSNSGNDRANELLKRLNNLATPKVTEIKQSRAQRRAQNHK